MADNKFRAAGVVIRCEMPGSYSADNPLSNTSSVNQSQRPLKRDWARKADGSWLWQLAGMGCVSGLNVGDGSSVGDTALPVSAEPRVRIPLPFKNAP